jgi:leucyl-tRNA---protein transferase
VRLAGAVAAGLYRVTEVKLLFSEAKPDYGHYLFPYAVWAVPEPGELPSDLFASGFLPASRQLDRFYLCRHVRIRLDRYRATSENRRILRKGIGIRFEVRTRAQFEFTPDRRQAWKHYADIKFGKEVMPLERLDNLMSSPIITHLLVFTDAAGGGEIGHVMMFLEPPRTAYYYYAFYDLNYYERNLGMFMMTSAVEHMAASGYQYLYLGTVYSNNALYKTQFEGAELFNGFEWTPDLRQLKHLLRRDTLVQNEHLLESEEFLETFYATRLPEITAKAGFSATLPRPNVTARTEDPKRLPRK